jgi:hypothetical protein
MNCQGNVNFTLPTQLPHKFSYIVAILGHNHFESPNMSVNVRWNGRGWPGKVPWSPVASPEKAKEIGMEKTADRKVP